MKILQITNKVPVPPKDGGSIASLRLAEGLADLDQEMLVLAMNTSKHYVDPEVIRNFERQNLKIESIKVDTSIRPLKAFLNLVFSKMPYNAERFISTEFKNALVKLLLKFKPDLIILENLYPAAYLKDIRAYSNAPIAYRAHNIESEIWKRTAENGRGLKKWYLNILANRIHRFEKGLVNNYDLLVPITRRDADALGLLGNEKPCFILPTGYTGHKKESMLVSTEKPTIAHLGALDWLPNQEGLSWFIEKVWPLLKKKNPELEFHLAGRNAPSRFEKKLIGAGITYHGEVENAEKFIQSYPIHVVPLFSGSGMRIKIVEAMAHGRVVVTTTIGTEGIDTQHDINILVADTPEKFAKQIIRAIDDPAHCRNIGKNAFTFVEEKLNNKILVQEFLEFVNENI